MVKSTTRDNSVEMLVARDLHNLLYLAEFTFAANKFSPAGQSEVELADAVVSLYDTLLIFQIKERAEASAGDEKAERAWFKTKILKEAKNQIRGTLRFLSSQDVIEIANERGRIFNLASSEYKRFIRIIIYKAAVSLPEDSASTRFCRSSEAGFIHIISYFDYVNLSHILRVPEEIVRYFEYREKIITDFPDECEKLPEASLVGGFVEDQDKPTYESHRNLNRLFDDEETWNLIPLISRLHEHQNMEGYDEDYYRILIEFMRLPRSMWREIKKRFVLSVQKVSDNKSVFPYRVSFPGTGIGIVFVPLPSDLSLSPDWDDLKIKTLTMMTALHKFDKKLDKAIGILFGRVGEYYDIQWCMIEEPWSDDPEMRAKLDEDSPFRPVSEKIMHGFYLET